MALVNRYAWSCLAVAFSRYWYWLFWQWLRVILALAGHAWTSLALALPWWGLTLAGPSND